MVMNEKEMATMKEELQTYMNEKFKDKKYLAVVSFIDEYVFDEKNGKIQIQSQTVRASNTTMQSPYVVMSTLITSIMNSVNQLLAPLNASTPKKDQE